MDLESMTLEELHKMASQEVIEHVMKTQSHYILYNEKTEFTLNPFNVTHCVVDFTDCRYVGVKDGVLFPTKGYVENEANIYLGYVAREKEIWINAIKEFL